MNGTDENLRLDVVNPDFIVGEMYQAVSWIQQYLQKLAKSGITISQTGLSHPYFLGDHDMQIAAENKIDWFDLEISIRIGEWNIPFIRFKRFILNGIREFKLPNGEIFILPEAWFAQFAEILSLGKAEGPKNHTKAFSLHVALRTS